METLHNKAIDCWYSEAKDLETLRQKISVFNLVLFPNTKIKVVGNRCTVMYPILLRKFDETNKYLNLESSYFPKKTMKNKSFGCSKAYSLKSKISIYY